MTPTNPDKKRMTKEQLRSTRTTLGLTQARLADLLKVRADTYRHWEGGREPVPYDLPERLATAAHRIALTAHHVIDTMEGPRP